MVCAAPPPSLCPLSVAMVRRKELLPSLLCARGLRDPVFSPPIGSLLLTTWLGLQANVLFRRLFPYSIAVGALTILFVGIILYLTALKQLLPGIVGLGCFIIFVLFMAGLVETSIQLYGPRGSVNSYCNAYKPVSGYQQGQGQETLAYIATKGICDDWKAVFAFYLVGAVFLIWMMFVAWQVQQDVFD